MITVNYDDLTVIAETAFLMAFMGSFAAVCFIDALRFLLRKVDEYFLRKEF